MRYKKLSLLVLSVVFIFSLKINALEARDISTEELQQMIAQLQQQIAQLQEQLSQKTQPEPEHWCHDFNVNLKIGDKSNEVELLRMALVKEGFENIFHSQMTPPESIYFDEQLASAVSGFQEKYAEEILAPWGLTHGTGFVGKTTRTKLNKIYGCEITKPYIKVISPNGGEEWKIGETYNITWESKGIDKINIGLQLFDSQKSIIGPAYPIVKNTDASKGIYSWNIKSSNIYVSPQINTTAKFYKISIVSTSFRNTGIGADESDNYFTIAKISEKNLPPVIDELSGPTQLQVNEIGNWTIKAHDPENGVLSYAVDWGDEIGVAETPVVKEQTIQTTKFSHSYANPKTYTVKFTITDNNHQTAESSISVKVVPEGEPYLTITSPNGGEEWEEGQTHIIKWKSTGVDKVNIEYGNGKSWHIAYNIPAEKGQYFWKIPEGTIKSYSGFVTGELSEFSAKIFIWDAENSSISDKSDDYFSIVSAEKEDPVSGTLSVNKAPRR